MGVLDIKRKTRKPVRVNAAAPCPQPIPPSDPELKTVSSEHDPGEEETWLLLHEGEIKREPFDLYAHDRVVDPTQFFTAMLSDVRNPQSPRRVFGALKSDINQLKCIFSDNKTGL